MNRTLLNLPFYSTDYRFFTDCKDYKLFNFMLCRQYLHISTTQIPTQQKTYIELVTSNCIKTILLLHICIVK